MDCSMSGFPVLHRLLELAQTHVHWLGLILGHASIYLHLKIAINNTSLGFSGGASGKEPACQRRWGKRRGFDPWVGKIPWKGNPLQYSYLGNPMDRGACQTTFNGVTKNGTRLSDIAQTYITLKSWITVCCVEGTRWYGCWSETVWKVKCSKELVNSDFFGFRC